MWAVLAVVVGTAIGWIFALRRSDAIDLVGPHLETVKKIKSRADAQIETAQNEHAQEIEEINSAKAEIEASDLNGLASLVRKTLD